MKEYYGIYFARLMQQLIVFIKYIHRRMYLLFPGKQLSIVCICFILFLCRG